MAVAPSPLARLHLLGGFRLVTPSGRELAPRGLKARAALAYLALAPTGEVDRGRLAGLLWSSGLDAKASLRQALREAREALEPLSHDMLRAGRLHVGLDLQRIWVDAREADRLARPGDEPDGEVLAQLYGGDLLEGFDGVDPAFDDWLIVERERLRRRVVEALETSLDRGSDSPALAAVGSALLDLEPANEAAHRALMRAHAAHGDLAAAIRQYQQCRDLLARDLNVAPSAKTEALLQQIRGGSLRPLTARAPPPAPAVPPRRAPHARIAVEPKALALGEFADQSLAAGVAASLREALSRIRWLSVVDTTLYLPGGAGEAHGAVRQLPEPSYCVYVSVLRARDRIRLIAELKDAETARILWADRFDRSITDDPFVLVDAIAATLAGRLHQEVRLAEIMRASRVPLESLSAYDCVLRAIPLIFKLTPESFAEAEKLLLKAQEADPHDSTAYAWRAFWFSIHIGQSWVRDLQAAKAELDFVVRRSIELDPRNALALSVAGHIAAYVDHDYDRALGLFEKSLRLDPSSAYAWDSSAVTLCYAGKAEEALRQLEASRELWQQHPDPYYFLTSVCIALLLAGQPDQAAAVGRRTVRENPNFQAAYQPLIASLGLIGKVEEADAHLASLRRLNPDFSIGWFRARYPPLQGEGRNYYVEGLRRAGVAE